jgi:hypothetical protein
MLLSLKRPLSKDSPTISPTMICSLADAADRRTSKSLYSFTADADNSVGVTP